MELNYAEFNEKRRAFKYGSGPRASGKTFRSLLVVGHAASVGERVTLYVHNYSMAIYSMNIFMDMFNKFGFRASTPTLVRNDFSGGLVVFQPMPDRYDEYIKHVRGNNTMPVFDV